MSWKTFGNSQKKISALSMARSSGYFENMLLSGSKVQVMGKYYVYELAYPDDFLDQELAGVVFYVGKGKGNRINFHEEAASGKHYDCNQRKCVIIQEIQAQGKQVVKRKVYETDVEQDAYLYEWILIFMVYGPEKLTNMPVLPRDSDKPSDLVRIKIMSQSLRKLKAIAALRQETMLAVLARLIDAELERTLLQEKHSP
jgi:hypothetical protein